MLEAITFDLWSTLIEPVEYSGPRVDYLGSILATKGITVGHEALMSAYSISLDRFRDLWQNEQRHMSSVQRVGLMLNTLSIELAEDVIKNIAHHFEETVLNDMPPLLADAKVVLASLHDSFKIGLICDSGMSPGRVMRKVLASHGVLHYFHAAVFSDEVGVTKPHSSIYHTALERLDVAAHDTMHIGDLLNTDILGAQKVGMKTVWLNPGETRMRDTTIIPDYEIRHLSAVLDIVEREKNS